ncbi:family 43 glycosylhydrolase [Pelagicoccus albus]|uniref:Family 43 glycosylhydrolase n=1 Tax=Pelagicoccus albus TaxID=415222 RepID=A0A7X1B5H3_9BACT|nr:family 43 glycosylhydrolase [Pelagicoccus albus]MBC2604755.1 family 43 glycosylhydrolase [Pelagicoccus albus]
MNKPRTSLLAAIFLAVSLIPENRAQGSGEEANSANPILPGYYADPSIVSYQGKHYIYATLDPWGGETLGCWESDDFQDWTYRELNWPTKAACTGPTSMGAMVWAPSVVQGMDGRFYMHVSVGSEVWVGVASHPLGPWENSLGDRPMISADFDRTYHMIDAQAFVDGDGTPYLYWGSGWNWTNGHCFAVELTDNMDSFVGVPVDITPEHYFEAPFMLKREGRYYLMYSDGKTTEDSYQVHYAIGNSPLGPFEEASNSPILVSDHEKNVLSPGHHSVFEFEGQHYILYHRHNIPFEPVRRQVCVDQLDFDDNGLIRKIDPSHEGPALLVNRASKKGTLSATTTASSQLGPHTEPQNVTDNNYATRWIAGDNEGIHWIQMDFGQATEIARQEVRPEYAWKPTQFLLLYSDDAESWMTLADFTKSPISGSPIPINQTVTARYLKIEFPSGTPSEETGLFEWLVR